MKSFFCFFGCFYFVSSFNLDVNFPIIISNPDGDQDSDFGQAVRFFKEKNSPILLVGAPRANSTQWKSFTRPGQMFRCKTDFRNSTGNADCRPYRIVEPRDEAARKTHKELENNSRIRTADEYDNMLLGSTIEVNSESQTVLVCGPRYLIQYRKRPLLGICFYKSGDVSLQDTFYRVELRNGHFALVGQNGSSFDFYTTGSAQMGLSAHFVMSNESNKVLLGLPGLHYWSGGLANATLSDKDIDATCIGRNAVKTQNIDSVYSYLGYSVTSFRFGDSGDIFYVAGAPYFNNGDGRVYLTKTAGKYISDNQLNELIRTQTLEEKSESEFFGAAVLVVFYSDGLNNLQLLVGAPQHRSSKTSYDEGKVYVYQPKKGENNLEKVTKNNQDGLQVKKARSRFGTTLASIGDLDGDGFTDVAVGAPFESEVGAVYIFKGSAEGIEFVPAQHIEGKSFTVAKTPISGFGISMDGYDVDSNGYPDIAVGSFRSGHVVVLKSRPVISINLTLTADPPTFAINYTNDVSFQLNYCVEYTLSKGAGKKPAKPGDVCAIVNLEFDFSRLQLSHLEEIRNTTVRSILDLKETKKECRNFTARLTDKIIQTRSAGDKPLKFKIKVETLGRKSGTCEPFPDWRINQPVTSRTKNQENQTFCKSCPVLKPDNPKDKELEVPISYNCGKKGKCMSDLSVVAEFRKPGQGQDFVFGRDKHVIFQATVENAGPHIASSTKVQIEWDVTSGVKLSKESGCSLNNGPERPHLLCDLRKTLAPGDTESLDIVFDISAMHSLTFDVKTEVFSDKSGETNPKNNKVQVSCKPIYDFNIALVGLTRFTKAASLFDRTSHANVVTFKQRFQVEKTGPSTVEVVKVEVWVPKGQESALEMKVKSTEGRCSVNGANDLEVVTDPSMYEKDVIVDYSDGYDGHSRRRKRQISEDELKRSITVTGFLPGQFRKSYILNCDKPEDCHHYTCSFEDIKEKQNLTIEVQGVFRPYKIGSLLDNRDSVVIYSTATMEISLKHKSIEPVISRKEDDCVSILQSNVQALPSWVIPVAAVGALLLLAVIAYILYKVGFFKRKVIPKHDDEKEQLNEAECPADQQPPPTEEQHDKVE